MFLLYLFALIAHSIMFAIFLHYNITIMACFNVVSISLYVVLLPLSKTGKKPTIHSLAIISSTVEVILHQILAIICLGSEVGFQYFFIMLCVIVILQSKEVMNKLLKIISCIVIVAIMIGIGLYSSVNEPLYILPDNVRLIMLASITAVSTFGIISFSLNQWNLGEHYRTQIEELLGERTEKIFQMQEKIIRNFGDILERRDGSTGGHAKRTSSYVEAIIGALTESHQYTDILTPHYAKMIISAAPLHDIGKISISDTILNKEGELTDKEFEIMKTHASIGGNMLKELLGDLESDAYVKLASDVATYHHERWNGTGYPAHLKGEAIPLCARIMAVADVFDALTSVRIYKDNFSLDKAYDIMQNESGKQFDPIIIAEFIRIRPKINEIYKNLWEES
jgi:HD-GYP domain-containing protein (c-di-GMP phosphodiesterase class II)